jgi:hypothetical protein
MRKLNAKFRFSPHPRTRHHAPSDFWPIGACRVEEEIQKELTYGIALHAEERQGIAVLPSLLFSPSAYLLPAWIYPTSSP